MKTDLLKKIVGFILSIFAPWAGYEAIGDMAVSLTVLAGVVYVTMEAIKAFGYFGANALKVFSYLLGPVLAMALWLFGYGMFEGLPWYIGLLIGFLASLASIFTYLTEWLEAVLALVIPWFKKQQEWKRAKEVHLLQLKEAA